MQSSPGPSKEKQWKKDGSKSKVGSKRDRQSTHVLKLKQDKYAGSSDKLVGSSLETAEYAFEKYIHKDSCKLEGLDKYNVFCEGDREIRQTTK